MDAPDLLLPLYGLRDGVADVRLIRADKMNALDPASGLVTGAFVEELTGGPPAVPSSQEVL